MAARPVRACLSCGKLHRAGGSRCEGCRRGAERERSRSRGTRSEQGYDNRWLILRDWVLQRDGWQCHYCPSVATTADHLLPKSRGGLSVPINLVACCQPCNSAKKDRTAEEFIQAGGRGGSNL